MLIELLLTNASIFSTAFVAVSVTVSLKCTSLMFQPATFSLCHVVKRWIRYERVCPSVCPSHLCVTPKWFKISKHALYYTLEGCFWFLKAKFSHPEFWG